MADYTEGDLFAKLIHHVQEAGSCASGIGQLRKDSRWHGVYLAMMAVKENIIKLVSRKPLAHAESMALLNQREQAAAAAAAQSRYAERVRDAKRDLVTLQ